MKKVFLTFISLTAATLLLLLTPSCSGLVSPSVPDSDSESTPNAESQRYTLSGSFSMPSADAAPQEISALSSPQRNAIPDTSSLTYTVEAKRSDGYTETTASDGSTYTFTNLTAGTWQITAYASTTGGTRVMQSETKSVTLSSTRPDANASLELTPSSGTGDIDIQVNWAADSKIGYCSWAFSGITNSGNNTNSPFNITTESIPSGTYALTLDFYTSATNATNGAKPIYSCTEYVSVYAGLTTNSWTASTAPHIGSDGSFNVTKECVETFVYRKIYVKQGADDSTATGTSERPFGTIEKAMARLKEAASKGIRSGEITASNPWELHVSGTITATAITGSEGALIEVDEDIECLAIIGEGSGATIDANALGTVVHVGGGGGVRMENVTLKNGSSTKGGGVCIFDGTFTMQSGSITGNNATQEGGGVYVADGGPEFIMYGGTISANTAGSNGGGVYCNNQFTMYDGTISGNSAMNGKGVYIESNGVFTMLDGTITANTGTMGSGGGVYNCNTFNMYNGTISANGATAGNGVYVAGDGSFTMYNGSISANTGSSGSGAVSVQDGSEFTMEDGTISGNLITGGVNISGSGTSGGTFTMNGGTISGNTAYNGGGGVYVGNGATFNMTDGTIKGNSAEKGGGVYSAGNFMMSGGTIGGTNAEDANEAQGSYKQGGGVYVNMNTFEMTGGTIEGNTVDAGGQGTGVYVENNSSILFSMKGNARVAPSNNVYLCSGRKITISDTITATSPAATITPANCRMNEPVLGGTAALIEANRTKFALSDSTYTINKDGNVWKDDLASLTYADMQTLIASPDAKTSSDLIMTPSSEHGSWQWIHMIGTKYVVKTTAGRYCTLEIKGISDDHVNVQTEVRLAGEETVHSWSFWGEDSDIDAVLGGESGNPTARNDIHVDNGTPNSSAIFYIMDYVYTP
ncbi:MAG: right-handed parallel beta-helix repeat-containing protein [Treponema sp.]|nr:right-handed parallel beta-helix repeat-containing protein [Treponema sp.]